MQGITRRTTHSRIPFNKVCRRDRPVEEGDDAARVARVDAHKLFAVAHHAGLGRQRRRDAVGRLGDVDAAVRLGLELIAGRADAAIPDNEVASRDGPVEEGYDVARVARMDTDDLVTVGSHIGLSR